MSAVLKGTLSCCFRSPFLLFGVCFVFLLNILWQVRFFSRLPPQRSSSNVSIESEPIDIPGKGQAEREACFEEVSSEADGGRGIGYRYHFVAV